MSHNTTNHQPEFCSVCGKHKDVTKVVYRVAKVDDIPGAELVQYECDDCQSRIADRTADRVNDEFEPHQSD